MEISNLPNMQQDFLTRMTESWARLSSAWTDAVKGLQENTAPVDRNSIVYGWMNPWAFQSIVKSPSTVSRFQEMIDSAAKDLPELLMHGSDRRTVKDIKNKWLQSYRNIVGEMFGIPHRSEAERFLDQWRTLFSAFSGAGSSFRGGLFPDFSAMISWMKWFPASGPESVGFNVRTQNYDKMFELLFPSRGARLTRESEEQFKRVMDAQVRFLNALQEFHEQIVSAASKGLEKVVGRILSHGVEQLSTETYQEFYRVWISAHEEALVRLFRSEAFSTAILDTIRRGIDAKKEIENLMSSGLSPQNVPSEQDLEAVSEEVSALRDRVERLEEEIQTLKAELIRSRPDRDNSLHCAEVLQQDLD